MESSSDNSDSSTCTSEEEELILLLALRRRKRKKRTQRMWVRSIFTKRRQQAEFHNLVQELRLINPESHFRYLRMPKERFDSLLSKVKIKYENNLE